MRRPAIAAPPPARTTLSGRAPASHAGHYSWLERAETRGTRQKPHRRSTEPTVKPAPTDARSTRFPFLSRPLHTASFSARGIVAAVVFPKFSMLMITLLESIPSFSVAD